jgi:hypothetical protein
MAKTLEQNILPQPVREIWELDWKVGSVLHGDCHRATGVQDKDDVMLWVSRRSVSPEQQEDFFGHVERILPVRDWGEVDYGVDAEGHAFVVLGHASTKSIDFDAPGAVALRNRFLTCVAIIAQLHEAGVSCGNITPGSFVVDSLGKVSFIGLLGGYAEEITSTVPLDIRPCMLSGPASTGVPSVAADVYALAVMGLSLFGSQFPPTAIEVKHIDEYTEKVRKDAPPWVLSVLATIVRESNRTLCRDAGDMLRLIATKDAEYLASIRENSGKDSAQSEDEKPLSLEEIKELFITPEQLRKRRIDSVLGSRLLRQALLGCLVVAVGIFVAAEGLGLASLLPARHISHKGGRSGGETVSEVAGALAMLRDVELAKGGSPGAAATNAKGTLISADSAPVGAVEGGAELELPKKISIEQDNVVLAHIADGTISAQDRDAVLALYPEVDDRSKVLLATAFAKVGGDTERIFRAYLEKQLQRNALLGKSAPAALSTDALFLATEPRLALDQVRLWGRGDRLSNDELWWLAANHSKKRSPVFPFLAEVILDRGLVEWPKSVFLKVVLQTDDARAVPYESLFRGAREGITLADANVLMAWNDPSSIQALLAVMASGVGPEIADSVFIGLVHKPGLDEVIRAVLQSLSAGEGESVAQFAQLVGCLGLVESSPPGIIERKLEDLRAHPAREEVVTTLLEKGSAEVIDALLRAYGRNIHPDTLIPLLDRPEAGIRRSVIPFLKEVRIASSKARIKERYDLEEDVGVRSVFEAELYPRS